MKLQLHRGENSQLKVKFSLDDLGQKSTCLIPICHVLCAGISSITRDITLILQLYHHVSDNKYYIET
jgi:hypothetical protein